MNVVSKYYLMIKNEHSDHLVHPWFCSTIHLFLSDFRHSQCWPTWLYSSPRFSIVVYLGNRLLRIITHRITPKVLFSSRYITTLPTVTDSETTQHVLSGIRIDYSLRQSRIARLFDVYLIWFLLFSCLHPIIQPL